MTAPICPNWPNHTPTPLIDRGTHVAHRCPGCGLFVIWLPKVGQ
jgi:hypothetical protein